MKFSIMNKIKLWIIILITVMVAGTTLLGIFGFNQTVDYNAGYEIVVDCEENFNNSETISKNATDTYFSQNGISNVEYAVQTSGSGRIIYKFNEKPTVNLAQLKSNVQSALTEKSISLEVSVTLNSIKSYANSQVVAGAICAVVALVVLFVYMFFAEKTSGALTVMFCGLLSSLLFIDTLGITRLPLRPFGGEVVFGVAVLSSIISAVMVNRFNQDKKMESSSKLLNSEIADMGARKSLLRVSFIAGFMAVISIALIILGTGYIRMLGLEVLLGSIVSIFTSFVFSPILWSKLKKEKERKEEKQITE